VLDQGAAGRSGQPDAGGEGGAVDVIQALRSE
jgi:hypothetical protein